MNGRFPLALGSPPPDVGVLSSQSVLMPDLLVNPPTMESLECMNILNL